MDIVSTAQQCLEIGWDCMDRAAVGQMDIRYAMFDALLRRNVENLMGDSGGPATADAIDHFESQRV